MAIATSRQRGAAIQTNETVWTWNNSKQFPSPGELLNPIKVQSTENARQIVGGSSSSFSIIKKDGTVWTWDSYWDKSSYKAIQVKGIKNAVDLASSQFNGHYALLKNGTVMKWTMELGEPSEPKPVNAPINVVMKGETLSLVIPPIIINNVSYVPLRGVFEPLGATIEWYQGNFTGVVKKDDITIEINTSSEGMKLNGETLTGELKPISVNYVTMVPLRFLSETLGAEVKWQSDKNTIYINVPK
ncbi:stalk domain-containing protein [Paenibacillus sp. Marseille-Q7038]